LCDLRYEEMKSILSLWRCWRIPDDYPTMPDDG
jgi:hypothetical protein